MREDRVSMVHEQEKGKGQKTQNEVTGKGGGVEKSKRQGQKKYERLK